MSNPALIAEWFAQERGITAETLRHFGVGVRPNGDVVIPYPRGLKVRSGLPHGERFFTFEGGSENMSLFNEADGSKSNVFLVEGETDTMRLHQELQAAGRSDIGVVGLPGNETWNIPKTEIVRPVIIQALQDAERVWTVLDNDRDYKVAARTEACWRGLRSELRSAKRVRLPSDVKDICEFFQSYDLETLMALTERTGVSRFKPLDFSTPPPPPPWLVKNLIIEGDTHVLAGEPNVGKSWLTLDLLAAVLRGRDWLGQPVTEPGRVLYVDEENPAGLVHNRLFRLGFTYEDIPNLRYLNNAGIRLDRPDIRDELLEEALDFKPKLIVFDSLTRLHSLDEDKAGPMAQLYNDSIKPFARDVGAAVVVLHHAGKTDSNSSYKRFRGSGEIMAQYDAGYDVREVGLNLVSIATAKSRWAQKGDAFNVARRDTEEGGVLLDASVQVKAPF